jgi:hypothetical protein
MTETIETPKLDELSELAIRIEAEDKVALELQAEKQGLFNDIVSHLRAQNAVSQDDVPSRAGRCKFRSSTGLKCAVGCLIPDDQYEATMESLATDLVIGMLKSPLKEKLNKHMGLLLSMQIIHDYTPLQNWEADFKAYATRNKLTLPEIISEKEIVNEEVSAAIGS